MPTILVAEDDPSLRKLMEAVLKKEGHHVLSASDGKEALALFDRAQIDLLICDIMMPDMDGYELTRTLRQQKNTLPILMITVKESKEEKVQGFTSGTDDYMVKPVDMEEMILRVAALLRRSRIANERVLKVGRTVLDLDTMSVAHEQTTTVLPQKEFLLLFTLLSYPRQIFTRQQLMDQIWGRNSHADERTVDVHIRRLREKFASHPDFDIVTVRGLGYKAERMS